MRFRGTVVAPDPTATAEAVGKVANHAHKPVLAAWMGGHVVADGVQLLNNAGIPNYNTPEKAVRAFMHLVNLGVPSAKLSIVSYGKERPVAVCNDISCWSQNRRAVTVLNASS